MSETLAGRRIVLVAAWSDLGGAERNALQVGRHLAFEEGADVEVLALTEREGRFRSAIEELGITWHPYAVDWRGSRLAKSRTLSRLALRLRRLRPDVLMPYCTRPNVLCGLVWRATGAALCVWNQRDLNPSTAFGPRFVARAARSCPLLIANSNAAGAYLVSELGAPAVRVRVIPDSAELAEPVSDRAEWRARLGLYDEVVAVVMLAHLQRGKDHETLLRAWKIVVDEVGAGAVLLLAGRPAGTEDRVKALAYDLELGRSVRFLGDVGDVAGLLSASDIGVLSSRRESFPNALLESMGAGLPVAGTDIPGIREVVGEAQVPFLAPPGDADALAAMLLRLHGDAVRRRRLGDGNRELVARREFERADVAAAEAIRAALEDRLDYRPSRLSLE